MRRVSLLILMLLVTSCTGQLSTVRQEVIREEREEPSILIRRLTTFNERVSNLKADALIVYRDEEHTLSFRSDIMAYNNLEFFRVDLYDFVFKTPLVTMAKKDNDIVTVNYIKKEYFIENIDQMDFERILGFDVPVDLLLNSVLAKVYLPDQNYEANQIDDYSLEINAPDRRQIINFNESLVPDGVQYTIQENDYDVRFDKHNQEGSSMFPLRITLRNKKRVLEINYFNVDLEAEPSGNEFLPGNIIPEGFTRID